jgi:ribosome biogenesis GTPase A
MSFWPVVKYVIKQSDVVLLILDARMPELSDNAELDRMLKYHEKMSVKVFNKIDLISHEHLNELKKKFPDAYFVSGVKNIGISELRTGLLILQKRLKIADMKVGIVGYPNVGKSAVINARAHRARAKVARHAGTTKGIQFVRVKDFMILDSPGVVPFEDDELRLGVLGAKNPEKLKKPYASAVELIKTIMASSRKVLESHYGIEIAEGVEADEVIDLIARKRGYLQKGGVVDEQRTIYTILRDWQAGKLKI